VRGNLGKSSKKITIRGVKLNFKITTGDLQSDRRRTKRRNGSRGRVMSKGFSQKRDRIREMKGTPWWRMGQSHSKWGGRGLGKNRCGLQSAYSGSFSGEERNRFKSGCKEVGGKALDKWQKKLGGEPSMGPRS